jgi:GAF domain-containing protein
VVAVHDVTEIEASAKALRQSNRRLTKAVSELTDREDTIRRHAERQRLLNSLARDVSGTLDFAEVLHSAISGVISTSGCARCSVGEYDKEANVVRLLAGWRRDGTRDTVVGSELPVETSIAGMPVKTQKPVVVDIRDRVLRPLGKMAYQGMEAIICVPIFVGERVWGVMNMGFAEIGQ